MPDKHYDAVILGSSLAGVISGAILANRGYKVAVIEALDQPGGRSGSIEYNGYWIDWGHRDADNGISDIGWIMRNGVKAERAAGIEIPVTRHNNRLLRIHILPENISVDLDWNAWFATPQKQPVDEYRKVVRLLGGITEGVDEVATAVKEVMDRLASMSDEEAWRLVPMPMELWLRTNVSNPIVRRVIIQFLDQIHSSPGENTSVGRFIFHRKTAFVATKTGMPNDPEVGGQQGFIMPWVRAIKEKGGEMWLGWKPLEIIVDHQQVRGVVAVNKCNFVEVFEAPVVISAGHGWDLPKLVDEHLLPKDFMEAAREVEKYTGDVVSWYAGLNRLPRLRSTGKVEDILGWQRILYGNGAIKKFWGGFDFHAAFSPKMAPEGKHLLMVNNAHSGEGEGHRWRHWKDAKQAIDMSVNYVKQYYQDIDECIEWSSYQYVTPPQAFSWYLKPAYRHPVKVSTISGLYVASSSAEGTAVWVDKEAEAALEATDLVEAKFAHLKGKSSRLPLTEYQPLGSIK